MSCVLKRLIFSLILCCLFFSGSQAKAAVFGSIDGPDTAFLSDTTNVNFFDTGPLSITKIAIGGGVGFEILWINVTPNASTALVPVITGQGSEVISFAWAVGEFPSFSEFHFDAAPTVDFASGLASVGQLVNLAVLITLEDGSKIAGKFIDDPAPGAGLVFAATPIPAALPLFATGLGVLGLLARRRKRKGAVTAAA